MAKPPLIVFYYDCTAPIKKVECAVKQKNPGLPEMVTRDKTYSDKDLTSKIFPLRGSWVLILGFSVCSSFLVSDGKLEVQIRPPQF